MIAKCFFLIDTILYDKLLQSYLNCIKTKKYIFTVLSTIIFVVCVQELPPYYSNSTILELAPDPIGGALKLDDLGGLGMPAEML